MKKHFAIATVIRLYRSFLKANEAAVLHKIQKSYRAAALYQRLSDLPDFELAARGLKRDDIPNVVLNSCYGIEYRDICSISRTTDRMEDYRFQVGDPPADNFDDLAASMPAEDFDAFLDLRSQVREHRAAINALELKLEGLARVYGVPDMDGSSCAVARDPVRQPGP